LGSPILDLFSGLESSSYLEYDLDCWFQHNHNKTKILTFQLANRLFWGRKLKDKPMLISMWTNVYDSPTWMGVLLPFIHYRMSAFIIS
jgi:hypothetical protein